MMTGQVCANLSRVIVDRRHHDALAEAMVHEMRNIRVGDPYDPESHMGPLAMQRQLERVQDYVEKGLSEGATLATGGGRPTALNQGFYFEPTLFTNVSNDMVVAREEIFGPVVTLIPCDGMEDAIRIANDSVYGLNGAVFTNDDSKAYHVARSVRTGTVGQNGFKVDFNVAFGGFKQSGIGREGGREGLFPYLEAKTLKLDAVPPHLAT